MMTISPALPPAKRLVGRKEQAQLLGGVSTRTVMRIAERNPDFPLEIALTPVHKVRDLDELLDWIERRKAALKATLAEAA